MTKRKIKFNYEQRYITNGKREIKCESFADAEEEIENQRIKEAKNDSK